MSTDINNSMNLSREMYQTLFKDQTVKGLIEQVLDANPNNDEAAITMLQDKLKAKALEDGTISDDEDALLDAVTWKGLFGTGTSKEVVRANLAEILKVHKAEANQMSFDIHIKTQGMLGGWFSGSETRVISLRPDMFTEDPNLEQAMSQVDNNGQTQQEAPTITTGGSQTPVEDPVAQEIDQTDPAAVVPNEEHSDASETETHADQIESHETAHIDKAEQYLKEQETLKKSLDGATSKITNNDQKAKIQDIANQTWNMPDSTEDINSGLENSNASATQQLGEAYKEIDTIVKAIESNRSAYGSADPAAARSLLNKLGSMKTVTAPDGSTTQQFVLKSPPPGAEELEILNQLKGELGKLKEASGSTDPLAAGGTVEKTIAAMLKNKPSLANDPAVQLAQNSPELLQHAELLANLNSDPANAKMLEAIVNGDEAAIQQYFQENQSYQTALWDQFFSSIDFLGFGWGGDEAGSEADLSELAATPGGSMNLYGVKQEQALALSRLLNDPNNPKSQEIKAALAANNNDLRTVLGTPEGQKILQAVELGSSIDDALSNVGKLNNATSELEYAAGKQANMLASLELSATSLTQALKDPQLTPEAKTYLTEQLKAVNKAISQVKTGAKVETTPPIDNYILEAAKAVRQGEALPSGKASLTEDLAIHAGVEARMKVYGPLLDQIEASLPKPPDFAPGSDMQALIDQLPEPQKTEMADMFLKRVTLKDGTQSTEGAEYVRNMRESIESGRLPASADKVVQSYLLNTTTLLDKAKEYNAKKAADPSFNTTEAMRKFASTTAARGDVKGTNFELLSDMSRLASYRTNLLLVTGDEDLANQGMKEFYATIGKEMNSTLTKSPVDREALYTKMDNAYLAVEDKAVERYLSIRPPGTTIETGNTSGTTTDGVPSSGHGTPGSVYGQIGSTGSSGGGFAPLQSVLNNPATKTYMEESFKGVASSLSSDPNALPELKNLDHTKLQQIATATSPEEVHRILGLSGSVDVSQMNLVQRQVLQALSTSSAQQVTNLRSQVQQLAARNPNDPKIGPLNQAILELENLNTGMATYTEGLQRRQAAELKGVRVEQTFHTATASTGISAIENAVGMQLDDMREFFPVPRSTTGRRTGGFSERISAYGSMDFNTFKSGMQRAHPGQTFTDDDLRARWLSFRAGALQFRGGAAAGAQAPEQQQATHTLTLLTSAISSGQLPGVTEQELNNLMDLYASNPAGFVTAAQELARNKNNPTLATQFGDPSPPTNDPGAGGSNFTTNAFDLTGGGTTTSSTTSRVTTQGTPVDVPTVKGTSETGSPAPVTNTSLGATIMGILLDATDDELSDDARSIRDRVKLFHDTHGAQGLDPSQIQQVSSEGGVTTYRIDPPIRGANGELISSFTMGENASETSRELSDPQDIARDALSLNNDIVNAPPSVQKRLSEIMTPYHQQNTQDHQTYTEDMTEVYQEISAANQQMAAGIEMMRQATDNLNRLMQENPWLADDLNKGMKNEPIEAELSAKNQALQNKADSDETNLDLAPMPAISGNELFSQWLSETLGIIRTWSESERKAFMAALALKMMDEVIRHFYEQQNKRSNEFHEGQIEGMNESRNQMVQRDQATSEVGRAPNSQAVAAMSGVGSAEDRSNAFNLAARMDPAEGRRQLEAKIDGLPVSQEQKDDLKKLLLTQYDNIIEAAGTPDISDDRHELAGFEGQLVAGLMPRN